MDYKFIRFSAEKMAEIHTNKTVRQIYLDSVKLSEINNILINIALEYGPDGSENNIKIYNQLVVDITEFMFDL